MNLTVDLCNTSLGPVHLVHDAQGALVALEFADHATRLQAWLARHGLGAPRAGAPVMATRRALDAYFAGQLDAPDTLAVHWTGTAFQQRCWTALRAIAPGMPVSYARQAQAIGQPTAARAVGRANAMNPVAIVVPCHRVIGSDAGLIGYAGGIERKRWLLAHEARHCARARQAEAA